MKFGCPLIIIEAMKFSCPLLGYYSLIENGPKDPSPKN